MSLQTTLCSTLILFLTSASAFGAHPLISDDAGTLGKGNVQVELNGEIGTDKETVNGEKVTLSPAQISTTVGVGISDKMDITFGIARPWAGIESNGISLNDPGSADFSLNMKAQLYEHSGFSIALKPQLGYSTAVNSTDSNYTFSYGATLVCTKELEPFGVHLNIGYTYNDYNLAETRAANRASIWNFSLAATYAIVKNFKIVADLAAATNKDKTSDEMPLSALAGAIYSVNKMLDLSAGLKAGLTKPATDLTGLFGITLKF